LRKQGRPKKNIQGQEFGRLTAMYRLNRTGPGWWECLCQCGEVVDVRLNALTSGRTLSCGCLRSQEHRDYTHMDFSVMEMQGGE
jgi:hypothetical protein